MTDQLLPMMNRRSARQFAKTVLRKIGLYPLAARGAQRVREAKFRMKHAAATTFARLQPGGLAWKLEDARPHGYDIICLPVMPWNSRVQRPQQLMRKYAEHGHRVFYASLDFHAGNVTEVHEVAPAIFETALPGTPGASVYKQLPTDDDVEKMATALGRLRVEHRIASGVVVVQLPFWTALAEELCKRFGWQIVYECMDDHSGFTTNCREMLCAEDRIAGEADLVIVSSDALEKKMGPKAKRMTVIRNACEYEHFAGTSSPATHRRLTFPWSDGPFLDDVIFAETASELSALTRRPADLRRRRASLSDHGEALCSVIDRARNARTSAPSSAPSLPEALRRPESDAPITVGFFGAIADWFDSDLVADLAEMRPRWQFELVGNTFTGDVARLEKLPNVKLLGEKPYAELPRLMAGWNCHTIPFRRIPLTDAMNPVKAYEILATGRPLVAVNLPELRSMAREGLLTLADDAQGFAKAIERSLAGDTPEQQWRRRDFAAANTWEARWKHFDASVRESFPLASILTATYNNLAINKAWLNSILTETDYPNYEIIAVDNGSTDGTAEWLIEAAEREPRLRVICNRENRGYAAANNQALRKSQGEFLCLLNNDTLVTRGWLSTLIGHLRKNPRLGLVGPVSNYVGNEAMIPVNYRRHGELPRWAQWYCRLHDGESVPAPMVGFFCVAMSKAVCREVGELDEQFGLGCFEDDDYCRRVRRHGYEIRFVHDAFVHHWSRATFRLLGHEKYLSTYGENQRRFEAKWSDDGASRSYKTRWDAA